MNLNYYILNSEYLVKNPVWVKVGHLQFIYFCLTRILSVGIGLVWAVLWDLKQTEQIIFYWVCRTLRPKASR